MDRIIPPYKVGFKYFFKCFDKFGRLKWVEEFENLIPTVGLNYIVNAAMTGGSQYSTWYIGLSETSYTPVAGETMTTIMTNAPECKKYDEAARVTMSPDAVAAGLFSNAGTPAEFTFNATASVKVCFLSTVATWDSTSGLLISAAELPSPRSLVDDDVLKVVAGIQLTAV